MSSNHRPKRGRGRPRRDYRIRVRGERRQTPDYEKLARALLEHAAMQERERRTTKSVEAGASSDADADIDDGNGGSPERTS